MNFFLRSNAFLMKSTFIVFKNVKQLSMSDILNYLPEFGQAVTIRKDVRNKTLYFLYAYKSYFISYTHWLGV